MFDFKITEKIDVKKMINYPIFPILDNYTYTKKIIGLCYNNIKYNTKAVFIFTFEEDRELKRRQVSSSLVKYIIKNITDICGKFFHVTGSLNINLYIDMDLIKRIIEKPKSLINRLEKEGIIEIDENFPAFIKYNMKILKCMQCERDRYQDDFIKSEKLDRNILTSYGYYDYIKKYIILHHNLDSHIENHHINSSDYRSDYEWLYKNTSQKEYNKYEKYKQVKYDNVHSFIEKIKNTQIIEIDKKDVYFSKLYTEYKNNYRDLQHHDYKVEELGIVKGEKRDNGEIRIRLKCSECGDTREEYLGYPESLCRNKNIMTMRIDDYQEEDK